jgi:hypothetical protein
MNSRKRPLLLAASSLACLLLAAPVSTHRDDVDRLNARQADGHTLLYAEQRGDRDINGEFAAYQRTRNEEETQGHLDRVRQDTRERRDDASRYYWWWPFTR